MDKNTVGPLFDAETRQALIETADGGTVVVPQDLDEGTLAHADIGSVDGEKIKFMSDEVNQKILPVAVKAFKKHLASLGVKPALAKKLTAHNESAIRAALTRARYESL